MSKISFTKIAIEFITVVLGILLAFGLNTCNENSKEKRQAKHHLEGIKDEIKSNKLHLEDRLSYHSKLMESLKKDPKKTNMVLRMPKPSNTAWRIAENHTFYDHVDFQEYKALVEIYDVQDVLKSFSTHASRLMSERNVMGPYFMASNALEEEQYFEFYTELKKSWYPVLEDITAYEKSTLNLYKSYLQTY